MVCWLLCKNLSNFLPLHENSTTRIVIAAGLLIWNPVVLWVSCFKRRNVSVHPNSNMFWCFAFKILQIWDFTKCTWLFVKLLCRLNDFYIRLHVNAEWNMKLLLRTFIQIIYVYCFIHPILSFVFWYFGHFSCMIFIPFFSVLPILPYKM